MTEAVREVTAEHPRHPVYVIGHSLEAAMATIAGIDSSFPIVLNTVALNNLISSFIVQCLGNY